MLVQASNDEELSYDIACKNEKEGYTWKTLKELSLYNIAIIWMWKKRKIATKMAALLWDWIINQSNMNTKEQSKQ